MNIPSQEFTCPGCKRYTGKIGKLCSKCARVASGRQQQQREEQNREDIKTTVGTQSRYLDCDSLLKCENCGNIESLEGYDVLGADGHNLFCNQCHHEGEHILVEPAPAQTAANTKLPEGITLRQWYAGQAMTAVVANWQMIEFRSGRECDATPGLLAEASFEIADAMIAAEREKS